MLPESIRSNRLKYVEALESGEYRQIRGEYIRSDKVCCAVGLGMLLLGSDQDYDADHGMLQAETEFQVALGLDDQINADIINWNDRAHLTFAEIAAKLRLLWEL
jgi:hypothetical protein